MIRLKSLDIMRGLTVALMILVNNGGEQNYHILTHSKWNGLTPCDLVFPFFLFMMGMSTYLSLRKTEFKPSLMIYRKIAKRTILLFLIGLSINWFDIICSGNGLDFEHLRIWAVLQRIALCYGIVSLLAIHINQRYFVHIILGIIIVYMGILAFGNGYAYDASVNIIAQTDLHIFGYDHLYHKSPVDPEGLLSTLPAIAHTMIGFLCCKYISIAGQDVHSKIKFLKISGLVMLTLGFFLSLIGFGINKRIWSPSYVFVTCGFAAWILSLLIQWIDRGETCTEGKMEINAEGKTEASAKGIDGKNAERKTEANAEGIDGKNAEGMDGKNAEGKTIRTKENPITVLFLSFGMNPLFLYVLSEFLAIVFGTYGIKDDLLGFIRNAISDEYLVSLTYALFFVAIHAAMGIWMYRKKIFIKL